MFYPVWGHCITDNIRRTWFLNSEIGREFRDCPIVYIPYIGSPLEKQNNFQSLLKILGVDLDKLRPIIQPTKFDKIILPDESFYRKFTNEYRETIDCIRNFAIKNRKLTSSKKIYYFYGRNQVGEERLAEYFKSKGYEIISPEKLTLDEQLNTLINCESFASSAGSCAHNSVFLRDGAEVIIIPRTNNGFMNGYQLAINEVHPVNVNYVDSTLSIFNKGHDSFCFIISEQLKRFFGDKFDGYEEENFKVFLSYVRSPLRRERTIDPKNLGNYNTVFTDFMNQLKQREDLIEIYNMPPGWDTFRPLLNYQTHIANRGWGDGWKSENQISNPIDKKRDIQAIKINFPNHKVYYSVYYNDKEGWSEEVLAPEMAGTTGKSKPIFGIRVRLDEAGSKAFDILYRLHKFDDTWTPWAKNGETLYSYGVQLNAIQLKLEPKLTTTKA